MLSLLLQRMWPSPKTYLGSLFIDKIFSCYTGEPQIGLIASGGPYPVVPDVGWHLGGIYPHILVPGRTDLMFHIGNWPAGVNGHPPESDGCVLVGQERSVDMVVSSKEAFLALCKKLCQAWQHKEDVILTITEG